MAGAAPASFLEPPGFRLQPGMPIVADVKIGERTVLRYLMSRVLPATSEGMREP